MFREDHMQHYLDIFSDCTFLTIVLLKNTNF